MQALRVQIEPQGAFADPVRGDTLFGQICWQAVESWGERRLGELLAGYTDDQPFLVVSDAFPAGFLPRPVIPLSLFEKHEDTDRKRIKGLRWLSVSDIEIPVSQWLHACVNDEGVLEQTGSESDKLWSAQPQPHNTINRMSGTTGAGAFAPYQMDVLWPAKGMALDLYLLFDAERIKKDELLQLLRAVGQFGYGRDASIGLGRFDVVEAEASSWPSQNNANAWMTLAPCAPQGGQWKSSACFYRPFTRFGRHGSQAVMSGRPFKSPVLMADTGALLTPKTFNERLFTGRGLGGNGTLSNAIPATVHQGYAPVVPVYWEEQP